MKITTPQTAAFDFQGRSIRTIHIHGQPWFVAKDVCEILSIKNPRQALSRLDDDEKGVILSDTLGGKQSVSAVNESGLYALIIQSRKPQAVGFRKWVTNEVLPSLRKTGFYALGREMMEDKANWEINRSRGKLWLLKELADLERDPKSDLEYLSIGQFLERQGIRLESRSDMMQFARQVQLTCQQIGEWPVKQYRRRIPATLWPEPVLRQCLSLLPSPEQPVLPLN